MPTLRDCLGLAGKLIHPSDAEALLARAKQNIEDGHAAKDAEHMAVDHHISLATAQLADIHAQAGAVTPLKKQKAPWRQDPTRRPLPPLGEPQPWEMSPSAFKKYVDSLPPHQGYFVPATDNPHGRSIHGQAAAVFWALRDGKTIPPEVMARVKDAIGPSPDQGADKGVPVTKHGEIEGDKINREWTQFAPDAKGLGIPRAEMPQVHAEHRGALVNFLKGQGIESQIAEVLPTQLKPSQNEYSPAKVDKARKFEGGDRSILVSSDNHVVDGHHQWVAALHDSPTTPMKVIRIDEPAKTLIPKIHEFPSAETAGGSKPVATPERAPDIKRGENSPQALMMTALDAANIPLGGRAKSPIAAVIGEIARRLHAAAPEAFRNMETHVLTPEEWKADKNLRTKTPDSAAAYDPHTNTLYLNSGKLTAETLASAIVHEAGHFAEAMFLGPEFTQQEWEKLKPDQRVAAYQQYTRNALTAGAAGDLTHNKRARSEWVAMQFARVVRGDTSSMSDRMKQMLGKLLEMIRSVVKKWLGDEKLSTPELDRRIVEMMGYEGRSPASSAPPAKPTGPKKPSAEMDELAKDLFGSPAEAPAGKYNQKFDPEKVEQANKFVGMIVRDRPDIRTKATLAQFLTENYPKAIPYSEAIFRNMESFADVNTEGTFAEHYEKAKPEPFKEIRDLIKSDATHAQKAVQMRQMAERRGLTLKAMQEQIEAHLVRMVDEIARGGTDAQAFDQALALYEKQPLLSARTSTSIENQAYSTPAPLAMALKRMTGVTSKTTLYEPTAGNGMLMAGANLAHSEGNELNVTRADALLNLGVGKVTQKDAKDYVPAKKFDVVHANPPFGSIDNVNYNGSGIRRLEHLISLKALEAMKDDGRAALILGANMNEGPTAKGAQWVFENYLYSHYNVADNFEVSGDLYGNQGAKWPVRVIVISGRRTNPVLREEAPKTVDRLDSWDKVRDRAEKAANESQAIRDRMGAGEQPGAVDRPAAGRESPDDAGSVSTQGSRTPAKAGGGGKPAGDRGGKPANPVESDGRREVAPPAGTDVRSGGPEGAADESAVGRQPAGGVERGDRESPAGPEALAGGGSERSGKGNVARKLPEPVNLADKQIPYVPRSKGSPFNTLTPTNIGIGTHKALDDLVSRVGPLDDYLADKLNTSPEKLREGMAADQIDGASLAIDAIENGGALIIGDQTGIGKGRQAAAVMQWAALNGKIPVFFTKDPKLFSDMFGDLKDIGGALKPLIFGDPVKASIVDNDGNVKVKAPSSAQSKALMKQAMEEGLAKTGHNAIFSTYSQINARNARQLFFEHMAHNHDVILVLDESHEAAGDGETSMQAAFMQGGTVKRGSGANKETVKVPGLLKSGGTQKGRGGVVYLSATYAKRHDNMPLYSRTDLGKASENFSDVVAAMKAGGVALQQALSEALAARGQYIRRERDFKGTNYNQKVVGVERKAELVRQVDQVTDVLTQIVKFSKAMQKAVGVTGDGMESTGMTDTQHSMTDFASVVHNQISQLLLSAKADEVVAEALAAHAKGEKPVVTMMNTMESFLGDYADSQELKHGAAMNLNWQTLLKHSLDSMLRVTTKLPNGDHEITIADPKEYGMQDAYDAVKEAIDETEIKFPVSPIDYIIQKLAAKGIKVGELTGRQSGIKYSNFDTGEGTYNRFKPAGKNALVNGFNGGALDGLLLNASGSTGLSIHASPKFKDSRKRHMIIAQAAADINVFIQTLGRILRTGMKPGGAEYTHLMLPLQAELRPAAVTNKKMKSLNANTTAESEGGLGIKAVDFLNKYGDKVVAEHLDGDPELQALLNIEIPKDDDDVPFAKPDLARQFTGRLALLPDSRQKQHYETIIPAYNEHIEQLRATGDYDLDIVVHDGWDGVKQSDLQLKAGSDESNILTASVRAQQWEVTDNRKVPTGDQMKHEFEKNMGSVEQFDEGWKNFKAAVRARQEKRLAQAEESLSEAIERSDGKRDMAVNEAQIKVNGARIDIARWQDTEGIFNRLFALNGEAVSLTDQESRDTHEGMLVGVKFPKVGDDDVLRVAPSRFQFRYLTNEPGGRMFVSGAQFQRQAFTQTGTQSKLADFTGEKGDDRYRRWVVTGNPIAAYKATGGKGKMVRFKSRDGDIVTGLLMKNSWNVSKLANDPRYTFAHGDASAKFLANQGQYGRFQAIASDGGVARISRSYYGAGHQLSVPAAKSTGAAFYLDPKLRDMLGDFRKVASRMNVDVPRDQLAKVADRIAKISGEQMHAEGSGPELLKAVNEANGVKPAAGGDVMGTPAEDDENKAPLSRVDHIADALKTLHQEITALPKYTGFNKVLNTWVGNRQIGIGRTERTVKAVVKSVPKKVDREAIYNWAEAKGDEATLQKWADGTTDPKLKAGYEAAMNLTPEQQAVGEKIKKWFDDQHKRAVSGGVMKQTSFIEDYMTHIVKRAFVGGGSDTAVGGKIASRFRFAQKRTFPTAFELEQAGYTLKTKDVAEVMAIYGTHLTNAIETRRLAKSLLSEKNDRGEALGKLILGSYKTDVSEDSNFINDPAAAREGDLSYKSPSNPAFRGWAWRGNDPVSGKPIIMQGEIGLHPDILSQMENAIGRSEIRQWYDKSGSFGMKLVKGTVKGLDVSQSALKGTMLGGVSSFHAVHEYKRALGNRVAINPVLLQPIDWNDPRTQMMVRAGVILAGDHDATKSFAEGLGSRSLIDKIPWVGDVSRAMADYTFHQLIPSLKWHTFNAVFDRNLKLFAGQGTPEDIAYLTAKQVNARFGHLNLADMNIDPTFWHAMSGVFLAPDFLTSNAINYAQDLKGAAGAKTGREPFKALVFTAGALWILARLINNLSDDDPHYEEPFGVIHNGRRYTMRNEAEDLWNFAHDTGKFINARLNPTLQSISQLLTKRNWRGEKITPLQTLGEWLTKWIPISARALPIARTIDALTSTGSANPISPWESFFASQGIRISRVSAINDTYALATKYMDKHGESTGDGVYPVSAYQKFRYALEDNNVAEAKKQADLLIKAATFDPEKANGKGARTEAEAKEKVQRGFEASLMRHWTKSAAMDQAFIQSLSSSDRAIVAKAMKMREETWQKASAILGLSSAHHRH